MQRLLCVASDEQEWQALSRELSGRFTLMRANGKEQALAVIDREPELAAIVAYWGALDSGPELMRAAAAKKPKLPRVLISERPVSKEAQALIAGGTVKSVVGTPGGVPGILLAAPHPPGHAMRVEPRAVVKVSLPVATSAWEGFTTLTTKDVSRGGAFFLYDQRVVPTSGTKCTVRVGSTEIAGVVAHVMTARLASATGAEAGFGVSFVAPQAPEWWAPLLPKKPGVTAAAAPAVAAPAAARSVPSAKERESAKNFASLGMGLYDQKNFAPARQKFELASRVSGEVQYDAMQAVCAGQIHARLGLADHAREAFERALQLDPACTHATAALAALKR